MWEQTLENIVHRIKTAYGISAGSYAYSATSPIQGPGQGSSGGPGACLTTTLILLKAMAKLSKGIQFYDPSLCIEYTALAKMFIDDSSKGANNFLKWVHNAPTVR